ncbi:MAG: AbrB/MazE/SpoVT family DNA-binding domain-containing protein [Candidatus Peregrinibacteria bacterium]|nr:AbrB/MazE/SpoVT family DNA-binding domain-containing protein [Candidatus Peregrinibacteria bacterium]MDZ4245220.1 AbrB/MazE/SpoVT family DNA-binding domain-containing protein [Candidatus Gracilibacteria bacterium]
MNNITVRKKGQITLPANIREEMGIDEDEILSVTVWAGKAVILTPQKLKTQDLLKKSAEMARKKGITLEEMLIELDEIRHNS